MTVSSVTGYASVTSADINAHTIQALIELVYCQTANNVLTSAMASLEQALSTTQNALSTLTGLQNLANDLTIQSKSSFSAMFSYKSTNASNYESAYNSAASAFFGTPLNPTFFIGSTLIVSAGSPGFSQFSSALAGYKSALGTEISYLSGITDTTDPNTLYAKLKIVYNDIPADTTNFSAVNAWVQDNYSAEASANVTLAGNIQQHLTDAITAGQSLNSSQQQEVQNYLFIFQQYYQSAAALLTTMEQIITSMAQAAGR